MPRFWDDGSDKDEDGLSDDAVGGVVGNGAVSVRVGSKRPCGKRREGGWYVMEWSLAKRETMCKMQDLSHAEPG